jgi:hypothetical protein
MVQFQYSRFQQDYRPPAPLIPVTAGNPLKSDEPINWVAQIDSGADRTVVPDRLLTLLGAPAFDTTVVEGFGGVKFRKHTYVVRIGLSSLRSHVLEVTEGTGEDYILLGRDVLNKYRVVLNGPELCVDIE